MSSSVLGTDQIDRLKSFNELAEELMNSDYIKESEERWTGLKLKWEMKQETPDQQQFSTSLESPNETYTRAILLTMRFFIQDTEETSLRNMAAFYAELPIDSIYKQEFHRVRKDFNDFLDEETILSEKDNKLTRRVILDNYLWGQYAHKSPGERKTIQEWKATPNHWNIVYFFFHQTLHEAVTVLSKMKELNDRVLRQYSNFA